MKKAHILTGFCLLLFSSVAVANLDDIDSSPESVTTDNFQYDPLNIAGTKKKTQADRLKDYRRKLERRNEVLVKKKIERMRYKQELALMKKLHKAFSQQLKALDTLE